MQFAPPTRATTTSARAKSRGLLFAVVLAAVALPKGVGCSAPLVIDAYLRPDTNPFAQTQVWEGRPWAEGWSEPEQFYPKYFAPAGSLHVILSNTSSAQRPIRLSAVDGAAIDDCVTTPSRTGRVIYSFTDPAEVRPGGWAECVVRLRDLPENDVTLTFESGDQTVRVAVPHAARRTRIESVSFSPAIDRVYIYVRRLDGARVPDGRILLDGEETATGVTWTHGPKGSGLALAQVALRRAWDYGSFHLIQADLDGGERPAYPMRAWDCYFAVGLFGQVDEERVRRAMARGVNTYFTGPPSALLDSLGVNYIPSGAIEQGRPRLPGRSGSLFHYNTDEPDAHDFSAGRALPVMERLGVNAELKVLPILRDQRRLDPVTPNLLLVNNTYKPLGWYVYGQIADVFATDPYVPFSGDQIDIVPRSLDAALDACAPNPLVAVLWATHIDPGAGWSKRPPTPEEERMMVFYALGCGARGIGYFADFDVETGEGRFYSASGICKLWEEIGRINRDVAALAPHLSIGCPIPSAVEADDTVWARAIMCGPDSVALFVVNRGHYIAFNTASTFAWRRPAENVDVGVSLPEGFGAFRVSELQEGGWVAANYQAGNGRLTLRLAEVDTARAFLIARTERAE